MAAERVAAAAGPPDASRWRRNGRRCNYHAITAPKAKIAGSTSTATPLHRRIHELIAISAKFFMIDNKKTLEPASSAEEKRDVNPTSALGPLLTCMRQGNQAICRTR